MEGFQKSVLFGAIIILIIALVIIGLALTYTKTNEWPPVASACPDYWTLDGSGNNATCTNIKKLGTCPIPSGSKYLTMNFNKAPYVGSKGLCSKYTWANNCGVSWDGVTYGVNNPCTPPSGSSSKGDCK
jgi:hypothetical protein